jgi:hypothetical protein
MLRAQNGDVGRFLSTRAQRVQEGVVGRIHNRTGRLASSVVKRWTVVGSDLGIMILSDCPYAMFVEEDTDPHDIFPVNAKALRWESGGGVHFATRVHHPGTKGQHMFRDSLPLALE